MITPALTSAHVGQRHPDSNLFLVRSPHLGTSDGLSKLGSVVTTEGLRGESFPPPPHLYPNRQLTNNNYNDYLPRIHNGQVTWYGFDGVDYEIFFWDGVSITQITSNSNNEQDPQIHNGQITWHGWFGADLEVLFWNGTHTIQLTNNNVDDLNPQIHNGQIVWQKYDGSDMEILYYNGSATTQITNNGYFDISPQIHNGQITWAGQVGGFSSDYEIFLWNGSHTIQLTDNSYDDLYPQIHNAQVTWEANVGGADSEIFFWNGTATIQLTSNNYADEDAQIHNGQVAWEGFDGSDDEILFWDGFSVTNLSSNTNPDSDPQLFNGQVTWYGNDGNDNEVYYWDGFVTTQLTNNTSDEQNPHISHCQVTWEGPIGNDLEIFVTPANMAPNWVITPTNQTLDYGEALDYQLGIVDDLGISHWTLNDTTHFALSTTHFERWWSSTRLTNTSTLTPGAYGLNLTVYDLGGLTVSGVFTVTVVDQIPPTWVYTPVDQTIELGDAFSYDLDATDIFGVVDWTINDTTYFAISGSGAITNNTALQVGTYGLRVTANDTHHNQLSGTFSVHVQDTTDPAWVQTLTNQVIEYCTGLSYDVNATDLSSIDHYWVNDTTTFSISSAGLITNATSLPVGVYWLEVRGYDPYSQYCTATIKITVQDTTSPVWITLPADQTLHYRESLNIQLAASDHSGIAWSINDTTHFAIDATGRITSTITLAVGSYGLNVTLIDPYGNWQSVTFRVTVVPAISPIPPIMPILVPGLIIVCIVALAFVLCETRRKS